MVNAEPKKVRIPSIVAANIGRWCLMMTVPVMDVQSSLKKLVKIDGWRRQFNINSNYMFST